MAPKQRSLIVKQTRATSVFWRLETEIKWERGKIDISHFICGVYFKCTLRRIAQETTLCAIPSAIFGLDIKAVSFPQTNHYLRRCWKKKTTTKRILQRVRVIFWTSTSGDCCLAMISLFAQGHRRSLKALKVMAQNKIFGLWGLFACFKGLDSSLWISYFLKLVFLTSQSSRALWMWQPLYSHKISVSDKLATKKKNNTKTFPAGLSVFCYGEAIGWKLGIGWKKK